MKNVVFFITGATIGSVITFKIVEKKYKKLADEEIASVVETFKNKNKKKKTKEEIKETVSNILDTNQNNKMENIIEKNNYSSKELIENIPYVIKPEQYGENNEYGTKSLTYYADEILADEIDNPITDNLELMLGPDPLSHFGEYEDDSVYIRDDKNGIDYEILKSEKYFSEIPKRGRVD